MPNAVVLSSRDLQTDGSELYLFGIPSGSLMAHFVSSPEQLTRLCAWGVYLAVLQKLRHTLITRGYCHLYNSHSQRSYFITWRNLGYNLPILVLESNPPKLWLTLPRMRKICLVNQAQLWCAKGKPTRLPGGVYSAILKDFWRVVGYPMEMILSFSNQNLEANQFKLGKQDSNFKFWYESCWCPYAGAKKALMSPVWVHCETLPVTKM